MNIKTKYKIKDIIYFVDYSFEPKIRKGRIARIDINIVITPKNQYQLVKYSVKSILSWLLRENEIFTTREKAEKYLYNKQKFGRSIIFVEDIKYEQARMAMTLTTRYHDWHNTLADKLSEIEDIEDLRLYPDLVEDYNQAVAEFNKYGDAEYLNKDDNLGQIQEKVEANNNQI